MPKVEIISFTGMDHDSMFSESGKITPSESRFAARLLAFTKNTRLNMNGGAFLDWLVKPWSEIETELQYMAGTIPSSWEFVDVTFALQEVSRACAQQITRTRFTPMDADIFGSYAMQSLRVSEADPTFHVNPYLKGDDIRFIENCHEEQLDQYKGAIARGIKPEDARGLLPMDTHCNLVVKFNLRQLVDMLRTRDGSLRVQGEYGEVARQMHEAVLGIWPWSKTFFEPKDAKAVAMIEEVARDLKAGTITTVGEMATKLAKAADLLKK